MTNGIGQYEMSEIEIYLKLKDISLGTTCEYFINFQSAVPEIFPVFPVKVGVVKNGRIAHYWNP
jgi:hypothetical protein